MLKKLFITPIGLLPAFDIIGAKHKKEHVQIKTITIEVNAQLIEKIL